MKSSFANFIREKRIATGLTLREFCRIIGFDASNWSKIERGLFSPPQSKQVLDDIASALNIPKGGEDYKQMLDLSALSAISDELLEPEIINQLPVFFRTVRGDPPTEEELKILVKKIRSAWTPEK